MSELSLKLVEAGLLHYTANNDTWLDLILVVESGTIMEHTRGLPPVSSEHDIITGFYLYGVLVQV